MKSRSERLAAHFVSHGPWEPHDSEGLDTTWDGIAKQRAADARRRTWVRAGAAISLITAAVVLFVVTNLGVGWFAPAPMEARQVTTVRALALADGKPLPESISGGSSAVALDDGSRIEVAEGARLLTKPSAPSNVELAIAEGLVTFDVKPGGPRIWRIDAGHTVVRVLGTRFSVFRTGARVEVAVERGRVQVDSDLLPGHARTLGPGESVRVEAPVGDAPATTTPADETSAAPPVVMPAPPLATTRKVTTPAPLPLPATTENDAMVRADDARRDGRPRDAVTFLAPVATSIDRRASLAAFTLGKITSLDLHDDTAGAMWFERAHVLGLPAALDEEAIARAAECQARIGALGDARRLGALYRLRFPHGTKLPATWPHD